MSEPSDPFGPNPDAQPANNTQQSSSKEKKQNPHKLLQKAICDPKLGADFFLDESGTPYITVPIGGYRETWPVRSQECESWLTELFFAVTDSMIDRSTLATAVNFLVARATWARGYLKVYVRVGEDLEGTTYLDLGGPTWDAIRLSPGKWEIVEQVDVKFRRPQGMKWIPSPDPAAGLAGLEALRPFLNVTDEDGWLAILAWMTHAFLARGPYAVLLITGQPGSAKTTASRILRALIDPSDAQVRSAPRDERDFVISASNNWLVAMDNLSHLSEWMSDALCRLASGGGFSTRRLYTNDEETRFNVCRPVLLNSIADIATRSDLLERLLTLELRPIEPQDRRREQDLWPAFWQVQPRILGALLTLTAQALALEGSFTLDESPRMIDFCHWGEAVVRVLGYEPGRFFQILQANAQNALDVALDASPVYTNLERYLQSRECNGSFVGYAAELMAGLNGIASPAEAHHPCWPKGANKLSENLRRLAGNLKAAGIEYRQLKKTNKGRRLALWFAHKAPPQEVVAEGLEPAIPTVCLAEKPGLAG